MKKSTMWGIGLGALVVVVAGVALASTATASEASPDAGKGLTETGVRHGIRYEGCSHFELEDFEAVKAWASEHKWAVVKWVTKLDELRENPEPAVVEAFTKLFPECPWPPAPGTTFGPERSTWPEAMEMAKQALANVDMSGGEGSQPRRPVELELATAIAFAMRERIKAR